MSSRMPEPKLSQQNIIQSITLHLPVCPLPIVHPATIYCPGKQHIRLSTRCKRTCVVGPGHLLSLLHGAVLRFGCPLKAIFGGGQGLAWALWLVCGDEPPSTALWRLSVEASIFSNLRYDSSSVGFAHRGKPSLPVRISEPWVPIIDRWVTGCSSLNHFA